MPRTARKALGGVVYHVLNRGNGRQRLFHSPGDYDDFVALLKRAKAAVPGVEVLAYCLMPNHWHLVLRAKRDGDLSRFVQRLLTAHVRRHHARRPAAVGHLYQGRFKSFPVQDDGHLLTVLRYVESNPLRGEAPLAREPGGWRWCSFAARAAGDAGELLDAWPVEVPGDWGALVRRPLEERERERLLASLNRGRPFGDDRWTAKAAARLGLAHTLRPRGRPPKPKPPRADDRPRPTGSRRRQGKTR
jgi:putative transposase